MLRKKTKKLRKTTNNSLLVNPNSYISTNCLHVYIYIIYHPVIWCNFLPKKQDVASEISVKNIGRKLNSISGPVWTGGPNNVKNQWPFTCFGYLSFVSPVWRPFQNKVHSPKTSCLLPIPSEITYVKIWVSLEISAFFRSQVTHGKASVWGGSGSTENLGDSSIPGTDFTIFGPHGF